MALDERIREVITSRAFTSGMSLGELYDENLGSEDPRTDATTYGAVLRGPTLETHLTSLRQAIWNRSSGRPYSFYDTDIGPQVRPSSDPSFFSATNAWTIDAPGDPGSSEESGLATIAIVVTIVLSVYEKRLRADVYNRLSELLSILLDPDEYEEGDKQPEIDSFVYILDFLSKHPKLDVPRLNLSRNGFFRLSWRRAEYKLTTLEFRPDEMIDWLVFAPPAKGSKLPQRAAGESAASEIIAILKAQKALEWMERADQNDRG